MKRMTICAAMAAAVLGLAAGEHDISQTSGEYSRVPAGEAVYAGNIAAVATNGMAYAVNTAAIGGTLTVCGVFQHSAAAGEQTLVKRGGFMLENAGDSGKITKAQIGQTAYSAAGNAWTVTKESGGKAVGKVADVADDGRVAVVVGK